MKNLFDKAVAEFVNVLKGVHSLKAVKTFINSNNLYNYRISNYYEKINADNFKVLVEQPCPTNKGVLDSNLIKISKMLRSSLSVPEKTACSKCPKQSVCRVALIESNSKPTVADYVRYIYAITQDPPKDEKMLRAAAYSISHLEKFIKNIDKFPVILKKFEDSDPSQPIQAIKKSKRRVKIPSKCV